MIALYGHATPNIVKITIALEEMALPYQVELVNILKNETFTDEFLAMNPTGKIPVIRDGDVIVYESNVILKYLAAKTGRFMPTGQTALREMDQYLFVQGSLQGPMFGQRGHFSVWAREAVPYAIRRYEEQGRQVDLAVERMLDGKDYFLGDDYSIVDMSFFGWYMAAERSGFLEEAPESVRAWYARVKARPAVEQGIAALPFGPPSMRRRV